MKTFNNTRPHQTTSSWHLALGASPRAMTLIELMVVIVILVTLVAGVLPLISPNNDARKIAEAARGLQTYFMQAQAEAARLGRPVGVGFRETTPGSGVAIDAFQMVVPPPYSGFGPEARVRILHPWGYYGNSQDTPGPNGGGQLYLDRHNGAVRYLLEFVRAPLKVRKNTPVGESSLVYDAEYFPANMLKWGDIINLEGNEFLIVDDGDNSNEENDVDPDTGYLLPNTKLVCIWLNNFGQQPPEFYSLSNPGSARVYRIFRQPASTTKFGPSSESAYQLPAGIAIDLQASGLESDDFVLFSTMDKQTELHAGTTDVQGKATLGRSVAIMFSPDGGIESVWSNGVKLTGTTRAFLMIGRQENAVPRRVEDLNTVTAEDRLFDFYGQIAGGGQTTGDGFTEEKVRDSRARINWLNLDSRWLIINGADGRLTVNQNASFNPLDQEFEQEFRQEFNRLWAEANFLKEVANRGGELEVKRQIVKQLQIEAAHHFVHGDAGEEDDKQ